MRLFFSGLLLILIVLIQGCTSQRSVSGRNIGYLYSSSIPAKLDVDYVILNDNSTSSKVFWRIDKRTLQSSSNDDGETTYSFVFRYRLYPSYSAPEPLDSGKVIFKEVKDVAQTHFEDSLEISTVYGRSYLLEITLKDLNSRRDDKAYLTVTKSSPFTRQSFLLLDGNRRLVYEPYVSEADTFYIRTAEAESDLYAKLYQRDFPIASPPFSMVAPKPFDFTPDELVQLKRDRGLFVLPVANQGFYQLTIDEEKKTGGAVFYFGEHYPKAKMVMDLATPLRFITTNDEYTKIMDEEGLKKNIDTYWLSIGGNADRARELIKAYYQRVERANSLFTSYIEGWKTDRGMCYIVFGPPNVVNRSTATETWLYGEEGKYNSLSLTFTKVVNPFTSNDYRLNRSASLKTPWYRAVEFWRQGRVLTYK